MDLRKRSSKPLAVVAALGLLLLYLTTVMYLQTYTGADSPGCRIVYMGPSYARIKAFDESHTKFASKYSLYLYREQGKDPVPSDDNSSLEGIPVLFIPGNAGSYRQVRSIASETSNLYFDQHEHGKILNKGAKNFDFFAADFNEDFTAFHGRTMLDQAEYLNDAIKFILRFYESSENPPKSVILLGHSMGGVVARVMLTLPNYVEDSVNTIITLASPHAAVPLTFDGDILKIYSAIDRFWFAGLSNSSESSIAQRRLSQVSLISITGGLLDSILPADYTTLGYLIPPTHGFTVFTTGIPDVWTPIDHLAIVWCGQLRRKVLSALLQIANRNSPLQTYDLETRMAVFRMLFLSGFEKYQEPDSAGFSASPDINIKLDIQHTINDKLVTLNSPGSNRYHLLHLTSKQKFSLLTDTLVTPWSEHIHDPSAPSVLLCKKRAGNKEKVFDLTNENTQEFIELSCVDASADMTTVPRSNQGLLLSDSSFGGEVSPFYAVQYESPVLLKYDLVIVAEGTSSYDETFLTAEVSEEKSTHTIEGSLTELMVRGGDVSLSPGKLSTNIKIPGAWSSLLAYKVSFNYKKNGLFEPLIRQWSIEPFETKWHMNLKEKNNFRMSTHGIAPYTPFKVIEEDGGINLEVWQDASAKGESPVELSISVDFIESLRLLVLRYRLAAVAMGLMVSLMVFLVQYSYYCNQPATKNYWPNFIEALSVLTGPKYLTAISLVLVLLNFVVNQAGVTTILDMIDPVVIQDSNEINLSLHKSFKMNSFFLGLEESSSLWFIAIFFFFMAIGINVLVYYVVYGIGLISARCVPFQTPNTNWNTRRTVAAAVLVLLVPFYLPYQFCYIISVLVQIISVVKIMASDDKGRHNVFNYQMSILMMMLWILPINIPILIVFVHNFTISWTTPFLSHHNFLAIIPILLMVERNNTARLMPQKNKYKKVVIGFLIYFITYSVVYGIRHTYWLHHLFNVLSCILIAITWTDL